VRIIPRLGEPVALELLFSYSKLSVNRKV
jgi:hypothetical protein